MKIGPLALKISIYRFFMILVQKKIVWMIKWIDFNLGLEKVVYSSVTKSVAAAPRLHGSARPEEKETHFRSTENSNNITNDNNTRLYRSALSLNNVDKSRDVKNSSRRDDKFLRGSTTSLIHTSREIPIILAPEPEEIDEESPGKTTNPGKDKAESHSKYYFTILNKNSLTIFLKYYEYFTWTL